MNKYFHLAILVAFYFAISISADDLLHSHYDHEETHIECQLCKDDSATTIQIKPFHGNDLQPKLYHEKMVLHDLSPRLSKFPRAPPAQLT